jgi:cell division inhibitor SepF
MSMLAQAARGIKNIWSHGDDDYEHDEDELDTGEETPAASSSPSKYSDHKYSDKYTSSNYTPSYGGGSSTPTRARNLRSVPIPMRPREKNIYTLRPKTQDEAAIAADYLKAGSAVVVNLESVDREIAVRIIDFMSGVCYGLEGQGHAMKLGDSIFLFTPGEFEISSDELDYGENREFFFKEVDSHGTVKMPAAAPAYSAPMNAPISAASSAPSTQAASNAYTSSFANSYNTPQQNVQAQSQSTPSASAAVAPGAQAANTPPRAQTLPTSSVYSTSGKAHVTVGGKPAPTSSLSPAPRPSSTSRSWER